MYSKVTDLVDNEKEIIRKEEIHSTDGDVDSIDTLKKYEEKGRAYLFQELVSSIECREDKQIIPVLEWLVQDFQLDTYEVIRGLERERKLKLANENNIGKRGRPSKVDEIYRKVSIIDRKFEEPTRTQRIKKAFIDYEISDSTYYKLREKLLKNGINIDKIKNSKKLLVKI